MLKLKKVSSPGLHYSSLLKLSPHLTDAVWLLDMHEALRGVKIINKPNFCL